VSSLLALLEQALGRKAVVRSVPRRPPDVAETYADVSAIAALTGFQPPRRCRGYPRFVAWFPRLERGGVKKNASRRLTPSAAWPTSPFTERGQRNLPCKRRPGSLIFTVYAVLVFSRAKVAERIVVHGRAVVCRLLCSLTISSGWKGLRRRRLRSLVREH